MKLLKRLLGRAKKAGKPAQKRPVPKKAAARAKPKHAPRNAMKSKKPLPRKVTRAKSQVPPPKPRAKPAASKTPAPVRKAPKPKTLAAQPRKTATPKKQQKQAASRPTRIPAAQRRKEKLAFIAQPAAAPVQEIAAPVRKKVTYPAVEWTQSERVKALVTLLKELARKGVLSDWRLNFVHARAAHLYLGPGLKAEDQLSSIREDLLVTAYRRFADGTMGEIQVPVTTDDVEEARAQLLDAAAMCEHTKREAYALAEPEDDLRFPQAADPRMLVAFMQGDGMRFPLEMHAQAKAAAQKLGEVEASSCELIAAAFGVRVLNSNGVDVSWHQTMLYAELALTCAHEGETQESWWRTAVASPDHLDLKGAIEQQGQAARDAARAAPNPGFSGDVLLSGQSLLDFFAPDHGQNPLVLHAFARLKRMGLSRLEPGKALGQFKGEPFTLSSDPALPFGLLSAPVDEEGTSLRPVEILRTGIFTNYLASQRYAQLMHIPATGSMRNVHVSDGATREEHLRGHNYFEIARFSWFNPDPLSGEFSAEVRLGYHWVRGRKTPFKGGHFTGNVFDCLLNARFSREAVHVGRYYGPRALLFKDATVTRREEDGEHKKK